MIVIYVSDLYRESLIDELDGVLILSRGEGLSDDERIALTLCSTQDILDILNQEKRGSASNIWKTKLV